VNFEKNVNKKLYVYGFVGSIFNAMDYDFGGGPRYPRASRAFRNFMSSPEYAQFLDDIYDYQANPIGERPRVNEQQLDPGSGWQFDANVGAEVKPITPLRVSFDYTKSRLRRNDTGLLAFDTDIFSVRSTYQFTRFMFVRTRVDYDSLRRNYAGQLLFGLNPSPGTAFYIGYNDNFNYGGFSPITGQFERGFERNTRVFFIRASYLFRKSF
jgi:hypothetical protein